MWIFTVVCIYYAWYSDRAVYSNLCDGAYRRLECAPDGGAINVDKIIRPAYQSIMVPKAYESLADRSTPKLGSKEKETSKISMKDEKLLMKLRA